MKIGFVVNDVDTEEAAYTTTRLAMAAVNLGHKSYTFGVGDFVYAPDGSIHAYARTAHGKSYKSHEKFLKELQSEDHEPEFICLDELDVAAAAQRPVGRCHRATLGPIGRHPVRPARRQPRRDGAQRPGESGPGPQQNLLSAVSRRRFGRRRASAATSTRSSVSSTSSTTRS